MITSDLLKGKLRRAHHAGSHSANALRFVPDELFWQNKLVSMYSHHNSIMFLLNQEKCSNQSILGSEYISRQISLDAKSHIFFIFLRCSFGTSTHEMHLFWLSFQNSAGRCCLFYYSKVHSNRCQLRASHLSSFPSPHPADVALAWDRSHQGVGSDL